MICEDLSLRSCEMRSNGYARVRHVFIFVQLVKITPAPEGKMSFPPLAPPSLACLPATNFGASRGTK